MGLFFDIKQVSHESYWDLLAELVMLLCARCVQTPQRTNEVNSHGRSASFHKTGTCEVYIYISKNALKSNSVPRLLGVLRCNFQTFLKENLLGVVVITVYSQCGMK